jgi:hypothetical protein
MRMLRIAFAVTGIVFAADHFFADGTLRAAVWWSAQQTAWAITNSVQRQVAVLRP